MSLLFVNHLAKRNSEALSYIPLPRLEEYEASGQIMMAYENAEPCGFLVHGWPRIKQLPIRVYQACIDEDARRGRLGMDLVGRLIYKANLGGYSCIRLRCATDLASNEFWVACGFALVGTEPGGRRRGRSINIYELRWDRLQ